MSHVFVRVQRCIKLDQKMKAKAISIEADVTVIVVSWNNARWLEQCLRQLGEQTVRPKSVVVVDNDSTDGSAFIAASAPGVNLIHGGANLGFAAGNNLALRQCDTEFVALLNPDAFVEAGWLAALMAAARRHPDVAAFGSRQITWATPEMLDGIGDAYHISGLVWRTGWGEYLKPSHLIERRIFSPCAAAALYRRQVLEEVGGFDDDYFCYVEDVDLGFRMRLAGYEAIYVPSAIVHHVGSASTGGGHSDFCIYHGHRNLVWTYAKNMPAVLFWMFLPLHILMNIIAILRFSLSGQASVIIGAKIAALRGLPNMWHKRQVVQRGRKISAWSLLKVMNKNFLTRR